MDLSEVFGIKSPDFGFPGNWPDTWKAYKRLHPDRKPLRVVGKCVVEDDVLHEQAREAFRHGFPEVRAPQDPPYYTPLVVVGAGLSAIPLLDEIREKSSLFPVLALKGAHDWLIENGIVPTFACALDPQQSRARCFRLPNKGVIYLCSSTLHPDAWTHLAGQRVMLFHQYFNKSQVEMDIWREKTLLPGGCTTGMRALPMMFYMGFRNFELYGFDSCIAPDGTYKVDGTKVEKEAAQPVYVQEREYFTNASLYAQVQDMSGTFSLMPSCKINAHGIGLFQDMLAEGKRAGWPV